MGHVESIFVALAYTDDGLVDEARFTCTPCGKTISKGHCRDHMAKEHELNRDDLEGWATIKDSGPQNCNYH